VPEAAFHDFTFASNGSLGLGIKKAPDGQIKVVSTVAGSPAAILGVPTGSRVLSIAGRGVDGMSQSEVRSIIGNAPRPFLLRVALVPMPMENGGGVSPRQRRSLAYPVGARVYVRRASGLETTGVVHSHDVERSSYSVAVVAPASLVLKSVRAEDVLRPVDAASAAVPLTGNGHDSSTAQYSTWHAAELVAKARHQPTPVSVRPPRMPPRLHEIEPDAASVLLDAFGKMSATEAADARDVRQIDFGWHGFPVGLVFASERPPLVVKAVQSGSVASRLDIPVGSELVAVNGQSVSGLEKREVLQAVAGAQRPLLLSMVVPQREQREQDLPPAVPKPAVHVPELTPTKAPMQEAWLLRPPHPTTEMTSAQLRGRDLGDEWTPDPDGTGFIRYPPKPAVPSSPPAPKAAGWTADPADGSVCVRSAATGSSVLSAPLRSYRVRIEALDFPDADGQCVRVILSPAEASAVDAEENLGGGEKQLALHELGWISEQDGSGYVLASTLPTAQERRALPVAGSTRIGTAVTPPNLPELEEELLEKPGWVADPDGTGYIRSRRLSSPASAAGITTIPSGELSLEANLNMANELSSGVRASPVPRGSTVFQDVAQMADVGLHGLCPPLGRGLSLDEAFDSDDTRPPDAQVPSTATFAREDSRCPGEGAVFAPSSAANAPITPGPAPPWSAKSLRVDVPRLPILSVHPASMPSAARTLSATRPCGQRGETLPDTPDGAAIAASQRTRRTSRDEPLDSSARRRIRGGAAWLAQLKLRPTPKRAASADEETPRGHVDLDSFRSRPISQGTPRDGQTGTPLSSGRLIEYFSTHANRNTDEAALLDPMPLIQVKRGMATAATITTWDGRA
jgi:hypothetical protein